MDNVVEERKFVVLSTEEIEEMINKAAQAGASVAADTMQMGFQKEKKEQKDRRLHNTKLLLKNYRMLKENCSKAIYEKENTKESTNDIIQGIMSMKGDKAIVDSIKSSAQRTSVIISHIDKMLDIYRIYCSKYTEKEKRQYKVIKMLYISKNKATVEELAEKFGVSKVTIYDDIKISTERISALFFGINGLRFFP